MKMTLFVLDNKEHHSKITTVVYVTVHNRPIVDQKTRKGDFIQKRELQASDDTAEIKLTLWGSKIKSLETNGVYKIKDGIINVYNGVKSINTNTKTIISLSTKSLSPPKRVLTELQSIAVDFPPSRIVDYQSKVCCPQCNKIAEDHGRNLFKCSHCKCVTLSKNVKETYTLKMLFGEKLVTFYHNNISQYFTKKCANMPTHIDDVIESMLIDESSIITLNSKNGIINIDV